MINLLLTNSLLRFQTTIELSGSPLRIYYYKHILLTQQFWKKL